MILTVPDLSRVGDGGAGSRVWTKPLIMLIIVVILGSALTYAFTEGLGQRAVPPPFPSRLTIDDKTFMITYVAATPSQRQKGLMNASVSDDTTMLFIFPGSDYYSFWMHGVNSSLDIIWFDASHGTGRVVYIVANAPPCYYVSECVTYTPTAPANYVLEAKAGFAARNNITIGTVIQLD